MKVQYYFRLFIWITLLAIVTNGSFAQSPKMTGVANRAAQKFAGIASVEAGYKVKCDTVIINSQLKNVLLKMNDEFSYIPFRSENSKLYYSEARKLLGRKFRKYNLSIETMGQEIHNLIPNFYRDPSAVDPKRLSLYSSARIPIVRNISSNQNITEGLNNRNIALWHSHGWYYENTLDRWEWQRARLFLTVEDIWTMSFVVPYLVPMLENAGAHVFLPRERDIQTHEIIIDSDGSSTGSVYSESGPDIQADNSSGYGLKVPFLLEGENPFQMGHCRKMYTQNPGNSVITYQASIPETGEYAVYISYASNDKNATDAHYSVYHSGGKTEFLVNQSMGGGTWIYLGTFKFEKGKPGRIELTNQSDEKDKWISADAVKLGGGTGNIVRGKPEDLDQLKHDRDEKGFDADSAKWLSYSSQRPKYQEAARYYLQSAGMPDTLVYLLNKVKIDYSNRGKDAATYAKREAGKDDYKDDYQCRGEWVNYLMGTPNGPKANPRVKGLGIPVDMALAFHTDAGITPDSTVIGSLMIYDTTFGSPNFVNGQSRWASRDLADVVQTQVTGDLQKLYFQQWTRRAMWNKQYSEAARPKVPTILSEVLSHQNFADMVQAQDPRFKFDVSRAFYKGILKFLAFQNKQNYVVQPLPVDHFQMKMDGTMLHLTWDPVNDPLEPTATPKSYKIYTRIEDEGFDNGIVVTEPNYLCRNLKPGVIYSFKITALNEGGESFPSEILACSLPADKHKPVLIVNGFDRICGPTAFDNGKYAGFLTTEDEGVADKCDIGFVGEQYDFNRKSPWKDDDASGFGSSHADQETRIIPGNTFDYPYIHGLAFRNNGMGFVSMSDEAFVQKQWDKNDFSMLDIIWGEEKTTSRLYGFHKKDFTLYTPEMQHAISEFISAENAKILCTGAYLGTDLDLCGDTLTRKFAADVLHYRLMTGHASKSGCIYPVNSVKTLFSNEYKFEQGYNPLIYKIESPDAIEPVGKDARVFFRYKDNNKAAGIGFDGKYHVVILGFPFETITTEKQRDEWIDEILKYWKIKEENKLVQTK